ncbi:MAG: nitroreductase family deazaflavin-dependent oxidoreductase [Acidimicrobiales bacterium]|nr:nitroreductase family deazaflavin-dependent oxidoreductase [Acidimicrobiales bacterium]
MKPLTRWFFRAPIGLYRVGLGGLLGKRFLLLEHTGRVSGLPRSNVLEVVEIGDDGAPVIVSGFGETSDWYRNVTADAAVHYTIGRQRHEATARRLERAEARTVFDRYRQHHPRAAESIGKRIGVSLTEDIDAAADQLPLFRLNAP